MADASHSHGRRHVSNLKTHFLGGGDAGEYDTLPIYPWNGPNDVLYVNVDEEGHGVFNLPYIPHHLREGGVRAAAVSCGGPGGASDVLQRHF